MEGVFSKGGSSGWEEFVFFLVICYMDVEMLLGCETAVVVLRGRPDCFLKRPPPYYFLFCLGGLDKLCQSLISIQTSNELQTKKFLWGCQKSAQNRLPRQVIKTLLRSVRGLPDFIQRQTRHQASQPASQPPRPSQPSKGVDPPNALQTL